MTEKEMNYKRYPRINSLTPELFLSGDIYAHFVKGHMTKERRAIFDKWCYCTDGSHSEHIKGLIAGGQQ